MRRKIVVVLVLVLVLAAVLPAALAAPIEKYELEELDMSVEIPTYLVTFTRNINALDPNLSAYGLSKNLLSSTMETGNIYLDAWDVDTTFEVIITMTDSLISDFNQLSDTMLSALASAMPEQYEAGGLTWIDSEIYQHQQAKFLKIYISQPNDGATVYGLQYYTAYAEKAINITLHSYTGEITAKHEELMQSIVDSVEFGTAPQVAENTPVSADAYIYTDNETMTTFTVPANWVEKALITNEDLVDVKFVPVGEAGMSMLYGSTDLWSEMSASERAGRTRADIDNAAIPKADIAEALGMDSSQITTLRYGGKEHYIARSTVTNNSLGIEISTEISYAVLVDNGYLYLYQFSGASDSNYFKDYLALLNSVKYPAVTKSEPVVSPNTIDYAAMELIVSLIITIALYSVPIAIYRYGIRKAPVERKPALRITIVYGVMAFAIMSAILFLLTQNGTARFAIVLWSFVNYKMLTSSSDQRVSHAYVATAVTLPPEPDAVCDETPVSEDVDADPPAEGNTVMEPDADVTEVPNAEPSLLEEVPPEQSPFCHKCGNKLHTENIFCNRCGVKVLGAEELNS